MSTLSDDQTSTPLRDGPLEPITGEAQTYVAVKDTADFARLRTRSRRYLATVAGLFLGAFTTTVLLAGWAPGLFTARVGGNINVGMLFAAGLIVLPATLSVIHLRYASRRLDPLAGQIRENFESLRQ